MQSRPFNPATRLITLDLGHTLMWPRYNMLATAINNFFNTEVSTAQVMQAERAFRAKIMPPFKMTSHFRVPIPQNSYEYYSAIIEGCLDGVSVDGFARFAILANEYHTAHNWFMSLGTDVIPALELLKTRFTLGVISNANGNLERDLKRLGIREHFAFVTDSGTEDVSKPDPEIFRRTFARADVPAEFVAHVGDHPVADVQGAYEAGACPILFDAQGIYRPSNYPGVPYFRNLVDMAEALINA
ncbi:MAG: HAD-IA family hydrolase [Patescibacteria group bacterium]|nr:HAD-IA family hydrolase [Patescibacteria group bacterium]